MIKLTYQKESNVEKLTSEIYLAGITWVYVSQEGSTVSVYSDYNLTSEQITTIDSLVNSHNSARTLNQIVYDKVSSARAYGDKLITDFAAENVAMGITQLGLTNHVRKALSEVTSCLVTGSLYDAVTEIKLLNPNTFDNYILTPSRLLVFRNKIETYLGVTLSSSWNE